MENRLFEITKATSSAALRALATLSAANIPMTFVPTLHNNTELGIAWMILAWASGSVLAGSTVARKVLFRQAVRHHAHSLSE